MDTTETDDAPRARRALRWLVRVPSRYRVSLCVYLAPIVATLLARAALGEGAPAADIDRLGYGWPALEGWRLWGFVTGAIVDRSLAISFIPGYTFVAVVLLEHKARHWRTAVAIVVGQVGGALTGLLLATPLRGGTTPFAIEVTTRIDFGISIGGFACLGAWTAYVKAPLRRPVRWAVSCYLAGQLLLSGLVFDVTHPAGWAIGVLGGPWLMRPATPDRTPLRWPTDALWLALGIALGTAAGIIAGWYGGGIGGALGWGPSR